MLTKASFLLLKPGAFNAVLAAASFTQLGNGAAGIILYVGAIIFVAAIVLGAVNVWHNRDFSHIGHIAVAGIMIGGATTIVGAFMSLSGSDPNINAQMPH